MNRKIIILVSIVALQRSITIADTAQDWWENAWPTFATPTNGAATMNHTAAAVPQEKAAAQPGRPVKTADIAQVGSVPATKKAAIQNDATPPNSRSKDHFIANNATARSATTANAWVFKDYLTADNASPKGNPASGGEQPKDDVAVNETPATDVAAANEAVPGNHGKNVSIEDLSVRKTGPQKINTLPRAGTRNDVAGKAGGIRKVSAVDITRVKSKSTANEAASRSDVITSELMKNVVAANNPPVRAEKVTANSRQARIHVRSTNVPARQTVASNNRLFKNYLAANNAPAGETYAANDPSLAGSAAPGLPMITLPSSGSDNAPTASQNAPGLPAIAPSSDGSPDGTESPSQEATPDAVTNLMYSLDDQYRIGPGDTVVYQVIEDQDAPTNLVVTDSGDLEVPYYGLVHAGGKTCQQLADEIKSLLEKNLYYRATVVIALAIENKNWVTGKVYVTGQVKNPGSYPIPSTENMTVSKAILAAGGFSDFSDQKHVRLIQRGADGEQTYVINVVDVWKGDMNKDMQVQPGDTVVVPARLINY